MTRQTPKPPTYLSYILIGLSVVMALVWLSHGLSARARQPVDFLLVAAWTLLGVAGAVRVRRRRRG